MVVIRERLEIEELKADGGSRRWASSGMMT